MDELGSEVVILKRSSFISNSFGPIVYVPGGSGFLSSGK